MGTKVLVVGGVFRCVEIRIYSEYVAVISVVVPVRRIVVVFQLNIEVIIINSPSRLIVGGRAIFIRLEISHQVVISGKINSSPRVRRRVRVCVRS